MKSSIFHEVRSFLVNFFFTTTKFTESYGGELMEETFAHFASFVSWDDRDKYNTEGYLELPWYIIIEPYIFKAISFCRSGHHGKNTLFRMIKESHNSSHDVAALIMMSTCISETKKGINHIY